MNKLWMSVLGLSLLTGCSTVDNQSDIDAGSSNKIAKSPCLKSDVKPFYVDGVWLDGLPAGRD